MRNWNEWFILREATQEISISDFGKFTAGNVKPNHQLHVITVSAERRIPVYINVTNVSMHPYAFISWSPLSYSGVVSLGLHLPGSGEMPDTQILATKFDEALKNAISGSSSIDRDIVVR